MALDLEQLRSCERCGLSEVRQRVVVGSGPSHPRLVVVGEAPGASEDEGGEPFIGRSGRLLTRLIEEATGLTRSAYFITNAVKCRPPANRTPTRSELAACAPWLEAQLADLAPAVTLCVGATAARAVLGLRETMAACHGRVLPTPTGVGLATYHPAAALRGGPNVEAVMRADLTLVAELLERS
jgi:DNA polymerase